MDLDIERAKELIVQRDAIDTELTELFSGTSSRVSSRKSQKCSACGEEGHSARTCPTRQQASQQ